MYLTEFVILNAVKDLAFGAYYRDSSVAALPQNDRMGIFQQPRLPLPAPWSNNAD